MNTKNDFGLPFVGYGTYQCSLVECKAGTLFALELGYRHIDTAEIYRNEQAVGDAIQESPVPREDIFITSKVFPRPAKDYQATIDACKESLRKLQTDYLDLYLIHAPLSKEHRLDQWKALIQLQNDGLVKNIGVSNYGEIHIKEIEDAGLVLPICNQIELHPLHQQKAILSYMKTKNIFPIAYSSLIPLSSWRSEENQGGAASLKLRETATVPIQEVADNHKKSSAQVLLKWALQHGFAILPKSSKKERIQANMDLFDFTLSDADMAKLDALDLNTAFAWTSGNDPMQTP